MTEGYGIGKLSDGYRTGPAIALHHTCLFDILNRVSDANHENQNVAG